jgi:hypothetical protein
MTDRSEAADLLNAVRRQQAQTRRVIGFGWMIAGLAGAVSLIGLALDTAGVSPRVAAVANSGLVMVVGVLAERRLRGNRSRFGVSSDIGPGLIYGALVGVAISCAFLALRNDAQPPPAAATIGAGVALMLVGLVLVKFSTDPRWIGWTIAVGGAVVAGGSALSPDAYGPRQLLNAIVLLGYAGYGWWKSGRAQETA